MSDQVERTLDSAKMYVECAQGKPATAVREHPDGLRGEPAMSVVGDRRFARDALCGRCLGSGADNGGVCPDCQGSGRILGAEHCGACGTSLVRQVGRFQFACAKGHTTVSETARRTTG